VTLDGLYINGDYFQDGGGELTAIDYRDSSGTIQNNVIWNISEDVPGNAIGIAIFVNDRNLDDKASTVTIKDNYIALYQTAGIAVRGAAKAVITGNRLDGIDGGPPPDKLTAGDIPLPGYGIHLQNIDEGSPTAVISKNVISHHQTGIFLGDASSVSITGNLIADTETGIGIESWCGSQPGGSNKNKVTGNTIIDTVQAVRLLASESDPSYCDPSVSFNTISKNIIAAGEGHSGHAFMVTISTNTNQHTPRALNNIISQNTIWDFDGVAVIHSGAVGTVVEKNILRGAD
jgi:nitrous oxidase accessory protein NosD